MDITIQVTPRRQLVADSDGNYLLTPSIANDMAKPIVTGSIDETSLRLTPDIDVGLIAGDSILIQIQVLLAGENYDGRARLNVWLTDSSTTPTPSSTEPTTISSGWSNNQAQLITDDDGSYEFTITNTTAHTWYLCVEIAGFITISEALIYT